MADENKNKTPQITKTTMKLMYKPPKGDVWRTEVPIKQGEKMIKLGRWKKDS
jgi:hypothetical protein